VLDAWVSAAEKALAANASSFAMLNLSNIIGDDNYLNALKAKGYQVVSPD
jgi:hypothetical protein